MQFSRSVLNLIKQRASWRSYTETQLTKEIKQQLENYFSQCHTGPLGSSARFELVTASSDDREALKGLGTYGFIKGASAFIVGAVKPNNYMLEDYGYLMEQIILFATDLDLGTCWMGGTFNRSNFAAKINPQNEEVVPAVTPIGYVTDKRSKRDRLIRWSAGSAKRKGWQELFFLDSFSTPLPEPNAAAYAVPLEMVRLGPSASNKQPWRIIKENEQNLFHFYMHRTKGYDKNQGRFDTVDLQKLDMGIAMCHFEFSALEINLQGKWLNQEPTKLELPEGTEYTISWHAHN
jgi:Putative TM nitroreductase